MDIIATYKKMVMSLIPDNLEKQLSSEKGEIGEGMKYYLLAALVVDITLLISVGLQLALSGAGGAFEGADTAAIAGSSMIWILALLVIIPILLIILPFITTGLGFILCKILGGTGTFANQFYQFAIVASGLMVINSIVGLVPCLGGLIAFALSIYYIYPTFLIYRSVHKLSNVRAGFVAIFPWILLVLLVILLFVLFASAMAALLGSLSSVSGSSPY